MSELEEATHAKSILVTSGASGLGRNITEAVLESGDRLVATPRDPQRLDDLAKNTAIAFARSFLT